MMFIPPCHEVARMMATGEIDELPWRKALFVRMHLSMCDVCSRYAKQLRLLGDALRLQRRQLFERVDLRDFKRRLLTRLASS